MTAPDLTISVRLFARARDIVGTDRLELHLPADATIARLRHQLVTLSPDLAPLAPHLLFAVGTDYVTDDAPIGNSEEIAVFPPVSGG